MTEPTDDVVERARQAVDAWDRFAVWAPTRVPGVRVCLDLVRDLVAEVERLRADLARMTERAEGAEVAWQDAETERDAARRRLHDLQRVYEHDTDETVRAEDRAAIYRVQAAVAERDEAVARAGAAESALKAEQENWLARDLPTIAEREPWRVLRAVDAMIRGHWNFDGHDSGRLLALADELEREHGETAKRDRLIVRAKEVYAATMGHETALAAVVDAVLAEVVDQ